MIARLLWIAVLLGLAVVATYAQIDRSSRFNPALAPLVEEPFRGFAAARLTQQAIAAQDPAASGLARELVRIRPLPAENLTLLSQARLLAGAVEGGLAALEEAGKRGWREPVAQQAMAQAALLSDNPDAASLRIAALLATGAVQREVTSPMVQQLAQSAEGRAAFARRLAEQGHWQKNFLAIGPGLMAPTEYVDLVARARTLNAELDCGSLDRAAKTLENRGAGELARQVWPGSCPT